MSNVVLSWLLFFVVGGLSGFLRYTNFLEPSQVALFAQYGPYVVLLLHVIVVLTAFGDSVFQGILCLIIPFYSVYYLFFVSDAFYLRAIAGGLLVGIAEDSYHFYLKHISGTVNYVDKWIRSGG